MGKIRLSFALMLLAALAVLLAGERLSRRQIEVRQDVDRVQLEEFALNLREEFVRMNRAFERRLWKLGERCHQGEDVVGIIDRLPEMRAAYLFQTGYPPREWIPVMRVGEESPPDVLIEGSRKPLVLEKAFMFGADFLEQVIVGETGWKRSGDQRHRVYWFCAEPESIVAILIDFSVLNEQLERSLRSWGEERFDPLHAGQRKAMLEGNGRRVVLGERGNDSASVAIPLQNNLGVFWVRGWDWVDHQKDYHLPTLVGAGLLALFLVVTAWLLVQVQKRSWQEAEERVSFTNRVSHELGTPLTNMALNLELAERSLHEAPKKAEQKLEKVREEVSRLGRLVGNVLTRSRKEQGLLKESAGPCIPDQVIGGVIEQFRPALERRGITIEWEGGAKQEIVLDTDALSQLVWNLISNVEKHAAQGRWLGVKSEICEDQFVVEVSDRGEGIPDGKREKIFEAFERIYGEVTEGVSGTGLGLSICRDLAEMMHGQLELIPSAQGSVFRLQLPIQHPVL